MTRRNSYWPGLAVVAVAFIVTAALTWRKWPDALVDFGTQLYMPWRIANGAVLYRDLFYFSGGPFSQHFNALLFKIFGVSFSTLIWANLIFAAAMVVVIYRNFEAVTDVWTAALIGLGVVLVFAFGQYTLQGNYNYIAPYTHESTHALVFSIFAIALLTDWIRRARVASALATGFCVGIVFLTKPEIFVALFGTTMAGFVLFYLKHGAKRLTTSAVAFIGAGMVAPLFFFFYFLRIESARDSLHSVIYDWPPILHGGIATNTFYKWCTGMDAPGIHLVYIVGSSVGIVLVLALYAWVFRRNEKISASLKISPYVTLLLLIAPLLAGAAVFDWRQCGWPLPVLSAIACLLIVLNYNVLEEPVFPLLWSLFGLALLAKLGLFPRIWHYGFALAMPAFASSVYLLFWLLPILLKAKFGTPTREFRIMVALVLLVGIGNLFDQSQLLYAKKTLKIGSGGDEVVTYNDEDGQAITGALNWAQTNMSAGATMAVLPDANMFNYLARCVNSTPCLFWDPNSIGVYGQSNMVAVFEKNQPDYIFLVQRDSSEFSKGYFGSSPDFGEGVMQWVYANYKTQALFGHEPLKDGRFGVEILKRVTHDQSGVFNSSKSFSSFGDRKFIPTSNDASVQPKPSGVM